MHDFGEVTPLGDTNLNMSRLPPIGIDLSFKMLITSVCGVGVGVCVWGVCGCVGLQRSCFEVIIFKFKTLRGSTT